MSVWRRLQRCFKLQALVPLKVLYSTQISDNASKVIRVLEPLRRLQLAGVLHAVALEDHLLPSGHVDLTVLAQADAIFLHLVDMNQQSAPVLAPLLSAALAQGVALICDTDDPYFFNADGCSFDAALAPHLDLMKQLCAAAHVLTVTTAPLKQELSAFARQVIVVPNMIDMSNAPVRAGGNKQVRVGWCGGPTHADDLAVFLPAIAALQRATPVELVIFGMFDKNFERSVERARKIPSDARAPDAALAAFGRMADALEGVRYQHVPSVTYAEFDQRLAGLNFDIGVCPLLDTRFNRCRSAVKFYQYAAAGTVTVASNVAPYHNECNILVDNTKNAWLGTLEALVGDENARVHALQEQRQYVQTNRSWQVGLPLYTQLFKAVCAAVKRGAKT